MSLPLIVAGGGFAVPGNPGRRGGNVFPSVGEGGWIFSRITH